MEVVIVLVRGEEMKTDKPKPFSRVALWRGNVITTPPR
jgi:hypothetical protein